MYAFLYIRHRLAFFEAHKNRCPITMVKFNPMGNMMFYAMSYDWCKGVEFNDPKVRTVCTDAFVYHVLRACTVYIHCVHKWHIYIYMIYV
jgi:hypothetical protein